MKVTGRLHPAQRSMQVRIHVFQAGLVFDCRLRGCFVIQECRLKPGEQCLVWGLGTLLSSGLQLLVHESAAVLGFSLRANYLYGP